MTTIGKEGMYISEQMLRQEITLLYVFELLRYPDTLLSPSQYLIESRIKEEKDDSDKAKLISVLPQIF